MIYRLTTINHNRNQKSITIFSLQPFPIYSTQNEKKGRVGEVGQGGWPRMMMIQQYTRKKQTKGKKGVWGEINESVGVWLHKVVFFPSFVRSGDIMYTFFCLNYVRHKRIRKKV
jgi:hypothetical protein